MNVHLPLLTVAFIVHMFVNVVSKINHYVEAKPGQFPYLVFCQARIEPEMDTVNIIGVLLDIRNVLIDIPANITVSVKTDFVYSGFHGTARIPVQELHYFFLKQTKIAEISIGLERIAILGLFGNVSLTHGLNPIRRSTTPFVETVVTVTGLSVDNQAIYYSEINMRPWSRCQSDFGTHSVHGDYFSVTRDMICSSVIKFEGPNVITQGPYFIRGTTPEDDIIVGLHVADLQITKESKISIAADIYYIKQNIDNVVPPFK